VGKVKLLGPTVRRVVQGGTLAWRRGRCCIFPQLSGQSGREASSPLLAWQVRIYALQSALADAAINHMVLWGLWAHHGRWSCREVTPLRSDRNMHHLAARSQEILGWDIVPLLSDFRPRRLDIPTPQARPKHSRKMTTFTRIPEGETPSIIVDVSRRLSKIGTSRMG
jgi:hypothetical protein